MRDPIAPTSLPSIRARGAIVAWGLTLVVALMAGCGGGEPADRDGGDAVAPPAPTGPAPSAPPTAPSDETPSPEADSPAAEAFGGPRGRVVRADGGDLRDVVVRLRQRRRVLEEVRCDGEGRFAFRRAPEAGPHTVAVVAPGFMLHGLRLTEPVREPLEIVIRPGWFLRGIVSTPRGEPIPRFTIRGIRAAGDGSIETAVDTVVDSTDGRFHESGFVHGEWWVLIRADGYAPSASRVVVDMNHPPTELDVRLRPGRELSGFVLEEDTGAPIAGARVVIRPKGFAQLPASVGLADAVTDANGRFLATNVPDVDLVAGLDAPDLIERRAAPVGRPGNRPRLLLARRGASLDGIVWNEGVPSPERPLTVRGVVARSATTDAEGGFRVGGLRTGNYRVRSGAWGTALRVLRGFAFRIDVFGEGSPLCVGVVTAAGQPVAGASVRIGDPSESVRWVPVGADGRFRIDGVRPGPARVAVLNRFGHVVYDREHTFAIGETVDVRCEMPGGRVEGLAEASLTARPLAGTRVALVPRARAGGGRLPPRLLGGTVLQVARDGVFRFDHVPAGHYALFAWRDGYAVARHDGVIVGRDQTVGPLRVPIHGGGIVRGNVRIGSRPVAALIRLLDADGRPLGRPGRAIDSRDGSFVFRGVRPGPHLLVVDRHGCFQHRRRMDVTAGGNPRLRIALDQLPARASQRSTDATNESNASGR